MKRLTMNEDECPPWIGRAFYPIVDRVGAPAGAKILGERVSHCDHLNADTSSKSVGVPILSD